MNSPELTVQKVVTDDLSAFLDVLPSHINQPIRQRADLTELLEVVLDLGRPPEARFTHEEVILYPGEVTQLDIDYVVSHISPFGDDNRAGIERTLHRISAIRNRKRRIVGLTCRVGRAVYGTIRVIEDLVQSGKSILLLGRPGVGKTTMLREVARVLADDMKKRVVIVDTSNEIAGDGDIPHPGIGHARRMQVPTPALQHAVMIEAVENHMPQVIVIDEIGTELEAMAARTIAERGVQLVATAHGNTLENLMMNPTLADLIGGIQTVTLSDEEARRRRTQKSVLERKAPPTFSVVVEIQDWDKVAMHPDVAQAVDAILRGQPVIAEVRWVNEKGEVQQEKPVPVLATKKLAAARRDSRDASPGVCARPKKLFVYGMNAGRLAQMVHEMQSPAEVVSELKDADILVTSRAYYRRKPQKVRDAEASGIPIYVLKNNSASQMRQCLSSLYPLPEPQDRFGSALEEAEEAAAKVIAGEKEVELSPQTSYIRRLQHQIAERHHLFSSSSGHDPQRRVHFKRNG